MGRFELSRYVNPWKHKRKAREAAQVRALKLRDGENCARCRRPIRFDLPHGHDQGARIEEIAPQPMEGNADLSGLRLTHFRCNASGIDHTGEVTERIRRKNEAELFGRSRRRA